MLAAAPSLVKHIALRLGPGLERPAPADSAIVRSLRVPDYQRDNLADWASCSDVRWRSCEERQRRKPGTPGSERTRARRRPRAIRPPRIADSFQSSRAVDDHERFCSSVLVFADFWLCKHSPLAAGTRFCKSRVAIDAWFSAESDENLTLEVPEPPALVTVGSSRVVSRSQVQLPLALGARSGGVAL